MQESLLHRRIDLHTHSTCSDGMLTPTELLTKAKEQNIEVFSLTDHDTLTGLQEAQTAADKLGIKLVPGVELSVQWSGIPLHMVVLGFDKENDVLTSIVEKNQETRLERAKRIAQLLVKQGLPDLYEKAVLEAGPSQIGRPHFARVMVREGLVKDENKAFDQYLGNKRLGKLRDVWPALEEVVPDLAKTSCDLVMAHPKRYPLTLTKLRRLMTLFSELGGNAMEVSSGNENPQSVRLLETISRDLGLSVSVGSDFHGPYGPWCEVGKFTSIQEASLNPLWHKWL
ncbi:phosphotransferase [Marinomonas sp. SBI22]|uniref:PHP domain-containing protein n=1 Tax=unclassified Marinomonas TaxID=196814 RepID=UPI0007AF6052|nr:MULTISPECIES: PHP domain-containing protein [unclassified Marinomonas]KZM40053.1 phosphotransferase [Marinomonas sp. SBI22]KZM41347.1 phosphotransferase [Marinomonas sp. SBI8L]